MDFDDIPDSEDQSYMISDVDGDMPPPVPSNMGLPEAEYDAYESVIEMLPEPEPVHAEDALTIFTRQWQGQIEQKRAGEFEHEKEVRAKAQEEMAAWRQQKDVRMAAKKDKNRSEQAVLVETLGSEVQMLKVWDRVAKLIDASENPERKGSDVSRMRKLFIHLKNEPLEVTRAAAGVTA